MNSGLLSSKIYKVVSENEFLSLLSFPLPPISLWCVNEQFFYHSLFFIQPFSNLQLFKKDKKIRRLCIASKLRWNTETWARGGEARQHSGASMLVRPAWTRGNVDLGDTTQQRVGGRKPRHCKNYASLSLCSFFLLFIPLSNRITSVSVTFTSCEKQPGMQMLLMHSHYSQFMPSSPPSILLL